MIKALYVGYGVIINYSEWYERGIKPMVVSTDCHGTISGDLVRLNRQVIATKPTDKFMLTSDNEITFFSMNEAEIGLLALCENPELALMITDQKGNSTPFSITKEKCIYPRDENNGNALKLIFDDTAPPARQDVEPTEKPLSENERTTMLKIIYGMAIDAYGYDPYKEGRQAATGEGKTGIASRISSNDNGIKITGETVKKYLDMAKELFNN